ncbi:MAG TPA: prenyltransferase [Candidatus Dormibacteraeota bacterium]|nr:prenyltransferase [Candidatus Dormibacteraeota bacterium]
MRRLLTASRPFSWINTCLPFLATAIAGGHIALPAVVLGTVYFLVPYNLLMYGLNDLYDYESDRNNPRKGGVEGAVLEPGAGHGLWFLVAATNLPLLIAAYPVAGLRPGLALTATAAVAAAYSVPPVRTKVIPGLDSLTSSLHFTWPAVCGALLAGAPVDALPWRFLAALLLWGIASHALGAIQDVEFDRACGVGSIATVIGPRLTAALSTTFYLAAAAVVAAGGGPALVVAAALIPYVLLGLSCLGGDAVRARRAWRSFMGQSLLSGFLITQLLLHLWGLGPRDPLVLLAWTTGAGAWAWALLGVAGQLAMRRRAPPASELPSLTVAAGGEEAPVAGYPGPVQVLRPAAMAAAEGTVVAILDAGTQLAPEALAILVEELHGQGGGMVALVARLGEGRPWERAIALLSLSLTVAPRAGGASAFGLIGAGCAAVDARSYRRAGGGSEVAGLAARIAAAGGPVRPLHGADLSTVWPAPGEIAARLRRSALAGALWGCAAVILLRSLIIWRERQPWSDLLWHPAAFAVIACLQVLSIAEGLIPRPEPAA